MKMNLKFLVLAAAVTCLTGCLEVKGQLTVNETIHLKDSDDNQEEYTPKNYSAQVRVDNYNNVTIDLGSNLLGTKLSVFKNTKYKLNQIQDGEKVYLTAAENGQNYDLEAMYRQASKYTSDVYTVTEPCAMEVKGKIVTGKQTIKYRDMETTLSVQASLVSPQTKAVVASFNGSRVSKERDYVPTVGDFHADDCK